MSKFKVGDKVLIEGEVYETNDKYALNVGVKFENDTIIYFADKYLKNNNKTYEDGLNDAWELMDKLAFRVIKDKREQIFGYREFEDILDHFTPQEALAKIEAYEKSQQIQVGDVVYADDEPDSFGVVTWVNEELIYVMWDDGSSGTQSDISDIHKTGRHIDIEHLLEQIRGNE